MRRLPTVCHILKAPDPRGQRRSRPRSAVSAAETAGALPASGRYTPRRAARDSATRKPLGASWVGCSSRQRGRSRWRATPRPPRPTQPALDQIDRNDNAVTNPETTRASARVPQRLRPASDPRRAGSVQRAGKSVHAGCCRVSMSARSTRYWRSTRRSLRSYWRATRPLRGRMRRRVVDWHGSLGSSISRCSSLAVEGASAVAEGEVSVGMGLLDEATAAALGGEMRELELISQTCCFMIYACERVRDFDRAGQWCTQMKEYASLGMTRCRRCAERITQRC